MKLTALQSVPHLPKKQFLQNEIAEEERNQSQHHPKAQARGTPHSGQPHLLRAERPWAKVGAPGPGPSSFKAMLLDPEIFLAEPASRDCIHLFLRSVHPRSNHTTKMHTPRPKHQPKGDSFQGFSGQSLGSQTGLSLWVCEDPPVWELGMRQHQACTAGWGWGAKIWEPGAVDEGLTMPHSGKEFLRVS